MIPSPVPHSVPGRAERNRALIESSHFVHVSIMSDWDHRSWTRSSTDNRKEPDMLNKRIAPVVLSAALLGSLAVGGVAVAAAPAPAAHAAAGTAGTHTGTHAARTWLKAHRKALRKAAITISATTIGITPQALVAELKSGKSIAQVAGEHGSSGQAVVTALTTAADAQVADAVTAGTLTSAQGAKIDARLPVRIAKLVNHVF
jgi:hypothetical protein